MRQVAAVGVVVLCMLAAIVGVSAAASAALHGRWGEVCKPLCAKLGVAVYDANGCYCTRSPEGA